MRAIPNFHRHLKSAIELLGEGERSANGPRNRADVTGCLYALATGLSQREATFVVRLAVEIRRVLRERKLAGREISPKAVLAAARARLENRGRKDRLVVMARVRAAVQEAELVQAGKVGAA